MLQGGGGSDIDKSDTSEGESHLRTIAFRIIQDNKGGRKPEKKY
ncbi:MULTISPECIES: hypothetical protein [Candidatus Ichthyocystis]|nr:MULTISPECIES: hypothetical protein [Ichthyocystis]